MIPYFVDGEWVGLLLVSFDLLQPGQSCVYWHKETRQYVHHFTYRMEEGAWLMRAASGEVDGGRMTRAAYVGRTMKLPKQPRF